VNIAGHWASWDIKTTNVGTTLRRLHIMANGDRTRPNQAWRGQSGSGERRQAFKIHYKHRMAVWLAWENASTSCDLHLGWEEKGVAQALDKYLAHRAGLFVGKGMSCHWWSQRGIFSSANFHLLSYLVLQRLQPNIQHSNTVMPRKGMGFGAIQIPFW